MSSPPRPAHPEGPGSVSGAPNLPEGFTGTFTSRYVDTGELRQHVVTGGEGPPLLLVHGWPADLVRLAAGDAALARDFSVVAPDQRGAGLSGKPADGYDTGTLAGDLVALMDALGHQRFALAGHDTGMWIGYALAADHPGRVDRLAVAETPLPGRVPLPAPVRQRAPEQRAVALRLQPARRGERPARHRAGRRSTSAGSSPPRPQSNCPTTPSGHYIDTLAASPEALHASFAIYRALDTTIAQNQQRKDTAADPARPGHRRRAQPG